MTSFDPRRIVTVFARFAEALPMPPQRSRLSAAVKRRLRRAEQDDLARAAALSAARAAEADSDDL